MGWLQGVLEWFADPANWQGPSGVPARTVEHIGLSAAALGLACLVALPLALWLGHIGRGGALAINITNIGRAVPTFAVLVILAIGPLGSARITAATILALTLFGIPPILTNAYVGIRGADRDAVESARGMGMSGSQVLRRVEVPLAVPMIMTGVRLAAVQIVATATIAALVAGGGLGRIITSGFARQDQDQIVAGAILVAVLALLVEGLFEVLQRRLDPVWRVTHGSRPTGAAPAGDVLAAVPGSGPAAQVSAPRS
jgi:osmoprotectant transport system permease protein